MAVKNKDALINKTIGEKFRIESFIGSGTMGGVYKARQLALDKVVALKVLHPEMASDETFVERFQREAKAASRLDHPNSVRVLDFGQDSEEGLLFIAMEYLRGRDLFRVIAEDWPLDISRVISITSQILAALAVAHDMGIIHRDLKPENIMISPEIGDDGQAIDVVKVCDFGIAKLSDETSRTDAGGRKLTSKGLVMGTPEYMSPEQARGEELDARSDLYAVGVILFQLLTGRPPFESESALGVALKHISEPPPRLSSLVSDVPLVLEEICLKSLAKRREERFQNAREMRMALRRALEVTAQSRPSQSQRRNTPRFNKALSSATLNDVEISRSSSLIPAATPTNTVTTAPVVRLAEDALAVSETLDSQPRRKKVTTWLWASALLSGVVVAAYLIPQRLRSSKQNHSTTITQVSDPQSSIPITLNSNADVPSPTRSNEPVLVVSNDSSTTPTASIVMPSPVIVRKATPVLPKPAPSTATEEHVDSTLPVLPESTFVPSEPTPEPTPVQPSLPSNPVVETQPTTPPAKPIAPPKPVVPSAPINVDRASVKIGSISASNGVPTSNIRSALSHHSFNGCYRDALRTRGSLVGGSATLMLTLDINGYVTSASLIGGDFLPTMRGCIESSARSISVRDVDTGDATTSITLLFSPN